MSAVPCRIGHAPEKEERAAVPIADGVQEGTIGAEDRNRRRFRWSEGPGIHPSRRGSRSLCSSLVQLDERLVEDSREMQRFIVRWLVTVDSGEVGPRGVERQRHAERSEMLAQVDGSPGGREPRQEHVHDLLTHVRHEVVEDSRGQRLFECAEPGLAVRQQHEQREIAAAVGKVQHLEPPAVSRPPRRVPTPSKIDPYFRK